MKRFFKKTLASILSFATVFLPFQSFFLQLASASDAESYVLLTDLWDTDKLKKKESSWKDARALKINQNESGNLITLNVDGEPKIFLNGIFAHAKSTLIFDISDYTSKGLDTFSTYIGVDTYAKGNGNGVQFTMYASKTGNDDDYTEIFKSSTVFKGTSNAEKVVVSVKDYNFLKLFVSEIGGNNSSDHSVYVNPMLYDKDNYAPKTSENVDWIETLEEYDAELRELTPEEVIENPELEHKLLQRTLVKRATYQILQAYANSDDKNKIDTLRWLFTDKKALKTYITGGEPLGNYVKSFDVLTKLYTKYKDDLTNTDYNDVQKETFLKMMMAISLTHSGTIAFWQSGADNTPVLSNPVKRYEVFKNLYLNQNLAKTYTQTFNKEVFETLTVEEMRWVVDARLSDEELPWLNWYTSENFKNTKYYGDPNKPSDAMNPYTYIWYNASFKWEYTNEKYYEDNSEWCASNTNTPGNTGYQRGANCESLYHTKEWGIDSSSNKQPRLWVVWEEDGVCGALSKIGENLNNAYGQVAAVTRQPGHAAYLVQSKTKNEDGSWNVTWGIGNDVSGWAGSNGTEKGDRLLLNWGTEALDYSSKYNGSYVILAQRAIDEFDKYVKSLEYALLADVHEDDFKVQEEYYRKIVGHAEHTGNLTEKNIDGIEYFNLDGWYGLIQSYLKNDEKTSEDFLNLGYELIANLREFPLAMNDMINLIKPRFNNHDSVLLNGAFVKVLKELSTVQNNSTEYKQGQAVRQVALSLLGTQEESVKFSFSGENANKIMLATPQPFEWAIDYSYNVAEEEATATWHQVTEGQEADLTEYLNDITAEKDIVVHIIGDTDYSPTSNSITIIDVQDGVQPKNIYANDLENKMFGVTDSMEWKIVGEDENWTKFSTAQPDLDGIKTLQVRDGAHDKILAGPLAEYTFDTDGYSDASKSYVTLDRIAGVTVSSQQNASSEAGERAIDGNANTYWHNLWSGTDTDRWIQIEMVEPIDLSKIEYLPRQDSGVNGRFLKAKLETSMDGENWKVIDENIIWAKDKQAKVYNLTTPTYAKYIKLTALESDGGFASAAMINLFENTTSRVYVKDLEVNFITDGHTYDGTPKEPILTVKHEETPLIKDEDYTVSYSNNINAGTATISLKGMGRYSGQRNIEFKIDKAKTPSILPPEKIIATPDMFVENETDDIPDYLIYVTGLPEGWFWDDIYLVLKPGKEIETTVSYYDNDADNYEQVQLPITVAYQKGEKPTVTLSKSVEELRFDIEEEQTIDYEYFKNLLSISDTEDDADLEDNKNIAVVLNPDKTDWIEGDFSSEGTYHVAFTITDSDGNEVEEIIEFILFSSKISEILLDDDNFTFTINEVTYTSEELTPEVIIKDANDHILTLNSDYEIVKYENNINAGIATVTIRGIGLYSGEKTIEFKINKTVIPHTNPNDSISVSATTTNLSDIELPTGWNWKDADITLNEDETEVIIIYAGDENHEYAEMTIKIIKEKQIKDEYIPEEEEEEEEQQGTTPTPPVEQENKPKDEDHNNGDNENNENETEGNNNENTQQGQGSTEETTPPDTEVVISGTDNPDTNNHEMPSTGVTNSILSTGLLGAISVFFIGLLIKIKNKLKKEEN